MSAMKRERQYDMFDVATGDCQLEDYLNQRYSENDLSSTFWIEKTDQIDELRPPKDGTEQIVIPIQGPAVKAPEARLVTQPSTGPPVTDGVAESPLPSRPSWEAADPAPESNTPLPAPSQPDSPPSANPSATGSSDQTDTLAPAPPPSMEQLLMQFRQATQQYEKRSKDETS